MTQAEFEKKLLDIKQQEEKYGVEIHITDLIDKDHLDCIWYGGEVGTIKYDGYIITIGAYGDVRLCGTIGGEEINIKDKNNGGYAYDVLGAKIDDEKLHALLTGYGEGNDYLAFENNNWFEVDLISPDGKWIDLCGADNVLDNDLLDCFSNIETYFEYVKWAKENEVGVITQINPEKIKIYYEVQHEFDKEYIAGNLIELFNDEGSYDEMLINLRNNPELLEMVAYRYRKYIEDLYSADDEFDCLRDAYEYCTSL